MILEDGALMQKGRLVRLMYLWLFCHLFEPLQQGGGTVPTLHLALCPDLLSPSDGTSEGGCAPCAVSPPAAGRKQAPAGCPRESQGTRRRHKKHLNKLGNRFKAGSGRPGRSRVNYDHLPP